MESDAGAMALSVMTAVAAGLIGCFAVMRRMALAADALSHVALPGIGIALSLGIHPLFGATVMLLLAALTISGLERRTRIPTEALIGVVFSLALAAGSLMSTDEELLDALLGASRELPAAELAFGVVASIGVSAFVLRQRSRLVLWLVSDQIARTSGVNVERLSLAFLVAFAITVALGLRYLGVLLMGSLIIIPAVTAKRLATTLEQMLGWAVGLAVVATVVGSQIASRLHRPSGPVIILVASTMFLVSLLKRAR